MRSVRSNSVGDGAGMVITAPAGAPPPPSAGGTYVRPGAYNVPARACGTLVTHAVKRADRDDCEVRCLRVDSGQSCGSEQVRSSEGRVRQPSYDFYACHRRHGRAARRTCCRSDMLILRSCSLRRSSSSFRCRAVTPAQRSQYHHQRSVTEDVAGQSTAVGLCKWSTTFACGSNSS